MKNMGREPHTHANWFYDVILGGQDGLVNVMGIVLGVTAANGSPHIIIAASMAAAFAEAVSMGAVAYTSTLSERDHYQKELQREYNEIETVPEKETEEIREIYKNKGFTGKILEEVVTTITANKDTWVNIMMAEELNLKKVDDKLILKSSLTVGAATLLGSFVPVLPFFFASHLSAIIISLFISASVLFFIGVYEAKTYVGNWFRNGIKMALIGVGAAIIGFFVGRLFGT